MAEIEHFVDPTNKDHSKFKNVAAQVLPLWTADAQESMGPVISMSVGEAVEKKSIGNQTIAYFMARTYLFLTSCGINDDAIRFRQHRSNEMAHYAQDCWDAEVETSYGWIEVAGHSDRACFDLTKHAEKTKVDMFAARPLKESKVVKFIVITLDKQKIGKGFKKASKSICEYFDNVKEEQKEALITEMEANGKVVLDIDGQNFELTNEFVKFNRQEKTVLEEKYVPHVIEPSFGLGRIVYCIFEHCFKMRSNDVQRTYFDFPAHIAPVKCSLLPLMSKPDLNKKVQEISKFPMPLIFF